MSEYKENEISGDSADRITPVSEQETGSRDSGENHPNTPGQIADGQNSIPDNAEKQAEPYQEQQPTQQDSFWQERPNPEQQVDSWQNMPNPQNQPNQPQYPGQQNAPWQNMPNQQNQPNQPQYPGQQNAPWQNMPNQQNQPNQPQYPGQQNQPNQPQYPGQQNQPNQPQYPGQQGTPWQNQNQNPGQQGMPWQNQQFPNYPNQGGGNFYQNQNPNFQNGNFQNPNMQNPNLQGQPGNRPPANPMAITSLVLGIISMLVSCCCFPIGFIIGFVLAMVGLVLAISSKKGKPFSGYAIAGLVLSILGICESLFLFFSYLITARMMQDPNFSHLMNQLMEQYERSMGPQMINSILRRFW